MQKDLYDKLAIVWTTYGLQGWEWAGGTCVAMCHEALGPKA